ncbi:tetratricopeptide repeat family protein [Enhygromyxa salina]|uniref:Tetratricopeptide repeat family protein n=1 Tax=Enhygromyxa salina TaxID=215803 RepID=A0A0C2CXC3_9BACT|nr:tetratricopeptide repeat protein [Enhygromyxa salina]KIG15666.1 tetratricopeptide repeat family protein [Enhygromyxa salina]
MADLLTLEHAWSRLTTHLEWADRFWVLFVFTDDPRVVEILRRRTQAQLAAANRGFVALRPAKPADIDDVILGLLEGATTTVSLIDLVRHDDLSGAPGWAGAWQRLLLRLNERRELLRRRSPAGGIVFATTLNRLGETPALAPDLWTIRALALRVASQPNQIAAPTGPTGRTPVRVSGERRDPVLARQAVDKARARGDESGLLETLVALAEAVEGDEVLTVAQEARALAERLLEHGEADKHGSIAAALRRLGDLLASTHCADADAEACYRRSLDVARVAHGTRRNAEVAAALLGLGRVLANMSSSSLSDQREVELYDEAAEVTREAVDIWRELVREQRDAYLPQLAAGLQCLVARLGFSDEAVSANEEAVELWRELARTRGGYLSELATSLHELELELRALGRWDEAIRAVQEVVEVERELSDTDPAARPKLAASLTSLGEHLRGSGQLDEALAATQEAVELWQQLADERDLSTLHGLEYHGSAVQLGQILFDLGRAEQAVAVLQRVTANYEDFVEAIKGELEQNDDEQA